MKQPCPRFRRAQAGAWIILALALPALSPAWSQNTNASQWLGMGRAALADGLLGLARTNLEAVLRQDVPPGEKAEAVVLLSQVLVKQNDLPAARAMMDKHRRVVMGTPYEAEWRYGWAVVLQYDGAPREAAKELEAFQRKYSKHPLAPRAMRLLAASYAADHQMDKAADTWKRLVAAYPESPEGPAAIMDWANVLQAQGQHQPALALLQEVYQSNPDSLWAAEAQYQVGMLLLATGQVQQAADLFKQALTRTNWPAANRARQWYGLAQAQAGLSNFNAAVEAAQTGAALVADPAIAHEGRMLQARLQILAGRPEAGIASMRQSMAETTDVAILSGMQLRLAQWLQAEGLHTLAEAEFQHHLESFNDPAGQTAAMLGKAWSLWELRRFDEAATLFEKAAAGAPADQQAEALLKAADAYFANRQYMNAHDLYARVEQEHLASPLAAQARYQRAESLWLANPQDRAADALWQSLADGWGAAEPLLKQRALLRLSQAAEAREDWDVALARYTQALAACPDRDLCARAWHARGMIRYRLGSFKEALEDFNQVVENYPSSVVLEQAFFMRGWCLYLLGEDQAALALCQDYLKRFPGSAWAPDVLFWVGEYAFNQGLYADAESVFARLAEQYKESALADNALFWAGKAAGAQREFLRAIEYYNQLAERYPDSSKLAETRFVQGDALSELGQFDAAILAFDDVIVKYPQSYLGNLAWGRKGDCQFTLGKDEAQRYEEALISYRNVLDSFTAEPDLKLQAEFKMGRCREKMNQLPEAFEHYMNVVYGFLRESSKAPHAGTVWFTRSAFNAAAIKENAGDWKEAAGIYNRVVKAKVPAAAEAQERLQKIRREHWSLF